MPNSDIHQPNPSGAVDRLTLTAQEVRGVDSSIRGMCCGCVPACCGCFEVETATQGNYCANCFEAGTEPQSITYCLSPGDPGPTCFAGE